MGIKFENSSDGWFWLGVSLLRFLFFSFFLVILFYCKYHSSKQHGKKIKILTYLPVEWSDHFIRLLNIECLSVKYRITFSFITSLSLDYNMSAFPLGVNCYINKGNMLRFLSLRSILL